MKKGWILPIVSGFLFAFAYPPYNLEFLVWLGFIPLFLLIISDKKDGARNNFIAGFVAGFVYFLIILKWLWSVYPLNWAGIENNFISFLLVAIIWLASAAGMALWWGFAMLSVAQIQKLKIKNQNYNSKFKTSAFFLLFPSIFTITEYGRSFFFGLLWAGSGTLWGPHWTLGNLAYTLHNNSLFLKLSSFIGIYGITFLIIAVNFLIFRLAKSLKAKNLAATGLIITSIFLIPRFFDKFWQPTHLNQKKVAIAVIQTKIPSDSDYPAEKQLENFKQQLDLLKEASRLSPEPKIIIFPESANFFKNLSVFLDAKEIQNFFDKAFSEPALIIDNSRVVDEKSETKSRVIYIDSKKGALGFYDKRFLTPGGEFIPYHLKFIISTFSKNRLEAFYQTIEFSKGKKTAETESFEHIKTGVLVCSGVFSNSLFRNLSKKNPDFLITLASTGIFKGSESLLKQNMAMLKFRASENNKSVVLAGNYSYSYLISNIGKLEKITPNKEWQLFTAEVVLQKEQTWYNKLGDIPLLILIFSTILIGGLATKSRSF